MLRFHLDENVDPAIASGLAARGIDVSTAASAGLLGQDDQVHLSYATAENRVLFTHDRDFLVLADSGVHHAGIAYCSQQSRSVGEIVLYPEAMAVCMTPEELVDRVEFL